MIKMSYLEPILVHPVRRQNFRDTVAQKCNPYLIRCHIYHRWCHLWHLPCDRSAPVTLVTEHVTILHLIYWKELFYRKYFQYYILVFVFHIHVYFECCTLVRLPSRCFLYSVFVLFQCSAFSSPRYLSTEPLLHISICPPPLPLKTSHPPTLPPSQPGKEPFKHKGFNTRRLPSSNSTSFSSNGFFSLSQLAESPPPF